MSNGYVQTVAAVPAIAPATRRRYGSNWPLSSCIICRMTHGTQNAVHINNRNAISKRLKQRHDEGRLYDAWHLSKVTVVRVELNSRRWNDTNAIRAVSTKIPCSCA